MSTNNHYRFLIITVFLVLAVLTSILIYTKFVNSPIITGSPMIKVQEEPTPIKPTFGSMTIKNSDNTTRHSMTDYLKLEILADSNQLDVVGYDVLVGLDSNAFETIQVSSELADFTLFNTKKENRLTITGTKKLAASGQNILTGNKILTLTLKPLKTGSFNLELLSEAGKEKTQLVDTGSNIYHPKLNNIEIEIY